MNEIMAYCRVSTKGQKNSLASQENTLVEYTREHNLKIIRMESELRSGRKNWTAWDSVLKKLLEDAAVHGCDVYVTDPTRLTRNPESAFQIRDFCIMNGIKIVFLSDPELFDNKEAYFETYGHIGYENKERSEATKRGLSYLFERNKMKRPSKEEQALFMQEEVERLKNYFREKCRKNGQELPTFLETDANFFIDHAKGLFKGEAERLTKEKERNPFTGVKEWDWEDVADLLAGTEGHENVRY